MTPQLRRVGERRSPVVIVDNALGDIRPIVDAAAALAPYPASIGSYYPGLRRIIEPEDGEAHRYVVDVIEAIAPFIGGAFDMDRFDLVEASFSMVTSAPATLTPAQRAPHFDSVDPGYLAILHFLSDLPGTGTAFYRQSSTGIEMIDDRNVDRFVAAARAESMGLSGYTNGSNTAFEQTDAIAARPDRLLIYQGSLLHSGIIPDDMPLSPDPRIGRLTANIFVKALR